MWGPQALCIREVGGVHCVGSGPWLTDMNIQVLQLNNLFEPCPTNMGQLDC